jgi:hypothetical protein
LATLADGAYTAGVHKLTFDASGLPSGTYIYRMDVGDASYTQKMMLLK